MRRLGSDVMRHFVSAGGIIRRKQQQYSTNRFVPLGSVQFASAEYSEHHCEYSEYRCEYSEYRCAPCSLHRRSTQSTAVSTQSTAVLCAVCIGGGVRAPRALAGVGGARRRLCNAV